MSVSRREKLALVALFAILLALYAVLPSLGNQMYASPDENAAAVIGTEISQHARAFIPEPLAKQFPWLHPRSFVSVGEKIVPVGFLGLPILLGLLGVMLPFGWLPFVGMLILLSSAFPLFRLLRRFGFGAAWWGTLVAMTVPSMILYANRSLFNNGIFLALGLWSIWLMHVMAEMDQEQHDRQRHLLFWLGGFFIGLLGAIRPVELVWLAPWWFWLGRSAQISKKSWKAFIGGAAIAVLPILFFSFGAYGSPFAVGYRVAENPIPTEVHRSYETNESYRTYSVLPYGFSPRHLVWNTYSFLGLHLWPWMLLAIATAIIFVRQRQRRAAIRRDDWPIGLCLWTAAVLFLLYGSGAYADNIRPGAATIGNSFLRYFLPIAPMFGFAYAYLWRRTVKTNKHRMIAIVIAVLLACFGIYQSFVADEEGIIPTRNELIRYSTVQAAAKQWFGPEDVIISDRSDKIFFPAFRAASPIPLQSEVARLVQTGHVGVGLFTRPLSQAQKDSWQSVGVEPQELGSFAREKLYRLVDSSPQ